MQAIQNFKTAYLDLINGLYKYYRLPTKEQNINLLTNYLIAVLQGEINTFNNVNVYDKTRLLASYLFTLLEIKLDIDTGSPTVMKNSVAARYNIFKKDILELLEDMRLFDSITTTVVIINYINTIYSLNKTDKMENIFLSLPKDTVRLSYNNRFIRGKKKTFGGMRVEAAQIIPPSTHGKSIREPANRALSNEEKNFFRDEFASKEPPSDLLTSIIPMYAVDIPIPTVTNPPIVVANPVDISATNVPVIQVINAPVNPDIVMKDLPSNIVVSELEKAPLLPQPTEIKGMSDLVVTANGEQIPNTVDGSTPLTTDTYETNLHTVLSKHKGNFVRVLIKEGQRNGQFCLVSKYFPPSTEKNASIVRFNKSDISMKWSTRVKLNKCDIEN